MGRLMHNSVHMAKVTWNFNLQTLRNRQIENAAKFLHSTPNRQHAAEI